MSYVSHFGVHRADGNIAFLIQGSSASNALGIPLDCPFEVAVDPRSIKCNHAIELQRGQVDLPDEWILEDPLFRAMQPIPTPNPKPLFIAQRNLKPVIAQLCELSSPIKPLMYPVWSMSDQRMRNELLTTNVQPLVITDIKPSDRGTIDTIIEQAEMSPRQLVMTGSEDMRLGNKIRTIGTNITALPSNLREVGGWLLAKHMRS